MNRRSLQVLLAALALSVVAVACGHTKGAAPVALWSQDASSVDNPWPDDRLNVGGLAGTPAGYFSRVLPEGDATLDTARKFMEKAQSVLAANGGYSVYAPIVVRVSAPVSTSGLAGFHLYEATSGSTDVPVDVHYDEHLEAILVAPHVPLAERTTYTLAVASDAIAPSGAFASAISSDPALAARAADAVSRGVAGSAKEIDLLLTFTTQAISGDLVAIQARIDGPLGDALAPSFVNSAGIAAYPTGVFDASSQTFSDIFAAANATKTGVGTFAQGVWRAFDFRGADGTFDASLVHGTSATPSTGWVDFRLCIPAGTPPAGGWPIVITSHGMSDDSDEAVQRCSSFNQAGIAVVGQTATDHGFRGPFTTFFDFTKLLGVRDEFRQSDAELLQMQRLLVNAKTAGIAPFDQLDASHPHYWGNSLGALFGGAVIPTSSHFRASGLSVPGARMTLLFDGKAGQLLLALFDASVHFNALSPSYPAFLSGFRELAQWAIDPADPGALALYAPADRKVLLQESLNDPTILNVATENLRRAWNVSQASAPEDPFTPRGALWVWDKDQYPSIPADEDPHNLYWDLPPMRHQMETWILSDGTNLAFPAS